MSGDPENPEHPERAAVTALADDFLAGLREWLSIPSIGTDPAHHPDVARSARWLADALRRDGWSDVRVWDTGPALPAVYACRPAADPDAPVVLVYGHHDVQPVDPVEAWAHPPFEPTLVGEELFGRGASDDKGQVAMHLLGVKAHLAATGATHPAVTVKLFVEGEEESGSPHLTRLLDEHRDDLAADLVVFTDTPLYARDAPTVCTGQRGVYGAEVVFTGGASDVHSGRAGGGVPNPATAIARLVAALHDDRGRVRLRDFYTDVVEPTEAERADYAALPFDEGGWLADSGGARATAGEEGWSTLERVWVRPTAEVNGIHGGYTGPGLKTIVPASASVKLSFRLVPDQRPERVAEALREFVADHTPPGLRAEVIPCGDGAPPYAVDVAHPAVGAVRDAVETAFDRPVRFSRTGGSGPAALLHGALGVPVVYLGATLPDDRIHAPDERVVVPLLLRGAEAAAHLWRTLPERLS
ncbi:M20/M25/M40 family metallo-hydrolase [Saccharothrix algeriensis]|uniref:Acetylornithine deacetylase/succinyl-diaminopimelate desuccinylase-like protein n=1 Tax=Saccharothrix algeriensis TaxID=173560 RepID=A0A8T8I482_9PSEU|nr:M20/M25/M40 family metallo-hydrolase [Saccharothrix algeriensis]MBM7811344.1 acetylornithine deacetylase/succinyl-diaminopimelate desuccinylase-like protein [Saccharothrix algeriensis]QTR05230.1 M20/M25/M40 family metallo-hydrolase [Saccharothrix algeriensis]